MKRCLWGVCGWDASDAELKMTRHIAS